MADRGDTHYHVPNLNLWFLISSVLLTISVVWTVIDDWNAEWKNYQRDFVQVELALEQSKFAELERQGAVAEQERLQALVEAAQEQLDSKQAELKQAERAEYEAKERRFKAEQDVKGAKGDDSWARQLAEVRIIADDQVFENELDEMESRAAMTSKLQLIFEDADSEYQEAKDRTASIQSGVAAANEALAAGTADLRLITRRIDALDPQELDIKAADFIRDFPGLDFVDPKLKVQKYVLDDLTFELNFTKKTRIDMCTTCHMGVERTGFEDAPQPHTTHPRLDLYLSSKSPHPASKIGCTICHRGAGEALSFQHADHRPSDPEEEEAWYHDYHFHKQHHWDYPMLATQNVEAGCVQCHTTSMELIAEDAPTVTKGYRLFEQKGCYACHKVEWFPTKRKPGPSLANLASKLTPEFVSSWISKPRDFRPDTHMPQIFHLENYRPDETIVASDWSEEAWGTGALAARFGEGRDIKGQEWNDTAIAAITSFLFANHPKQDLDALPADGDPERGREVMRVVGCYACHAINEHTDEEQQEYLDLMAHTYTPPDPAVEKRRYNTHGPNLRGVNTKITADWLYNWLKNPSAYWSETRMPDLNLSDQDAADITAYMMEDPDSIFGDAPAGWSTELSPETVEVLAEQAKWFYGKLPRRQIAGRLSGESAEANWADGATLRNDVGEALVRYYGCYSCHEIKGMENDMPIGTELTSWGSKTVDKLDFGMAYRKPLELELDGEISTLPKLDHHYREPWLARKLDHPRSWDIDKIKNPKEKLRMPWFDFEEDEIGAISTFVLGLVIDETQDARMNPTPAKSGMDTGMRVVRQKNCVACHQVDPATVTFMKGGQEITVQGSLLPFTDERTPPTMESMAALEAQMTDWADYWEEDPIEDVVVRLASTHPDVGGAGETAIIPVGDLVGVSPPVGGDMVDLITEYYQSGMNVPDAEYTPDVDPDSDDFIPPYFAWTLGYDEDNEENLIEDVDGVQRAYGGEEYDKVRWTFAPPVLWNEGHKVQREWFYSFLQDPQTLRAQMRTQMPRFHYDAGEAEAVADYFAEKARIEWYQRYAKTARLTLGRQPRPDVEPGNEAWADASPTSWPLVGLMCEVSPGLSVEEVAAGSGLSPAVIRAIEAGSAPDIAADFPKLLAWYTEQGFTMVGQTSPSYEAIQRRSASYFSGQGSHNLAMGENIAANGVNCYQCHPTPEGVRPETPIAWAPPLENTRERLRESWVWEWLWSPPRVYPGTAMPENFVSDTLQYQDQAPGTSNAQQIGAVMDWLYNMDRPAPAGQ